jgi:DNA-binding transcriptional regulator GbsR (MarR family)
MDRKNSEITMFGHRIPEEIYKDYEKLKELKQTIEEIVNDSEIDPDKKEKIKQILQKVADHFEEMKPSMENKPRPSW